MRKSWLLATLLAAPAAPSTPCLPEETRAYVPHFGIDVSDFSDQDLCREDSQTKKLLAALLALEHGRFAAPAAPDTPLLTAREEPDFDFASGRIRRVGRGVCGPPSPARIACFDTSLGRMGLEAPFFSLSTAARAATVMHEARHADGKPHVPCRDDGAEDSSGSCDPDLSYAGAYAVELNYLARVALHGLNFHPAFRALARFNAMSLLAGNFRRPPLLPQEYLAFVREADGRLVYLGAEGPAEYPATTFKDARIFPRRFGLSVLPHDQKANAWPLELSEADPSKRAPAAELLGHALRAYNQTPPPARPELKALLHRGRLQARLYPDRLEVSRDDLASARIELSMPLPAGAPAFVGFVEGPLCGRPRRLAGDPAGEPVQLFTANGGIYRPAGKRSWLRHPVWEEAGCRLPAGLRAITPFRGQYLALTADGRVGAIPPGGGEALLPFAPLAKERASQLFAFSGYEEFLRAAPAESEHARAGPRSETKSEL